MIRRILPLIVLVAFPMIGETCVEQVAELPGGPAAAEYITIAGDIAIVSSRWPPVAWIVDISDPLHPVEMGALPVGSYHGGLAIEGDYAYVAVGWNDEQTGGLSVVSLADLLAPVEVGFAPLEASPKDVEVRWPYAFTVGSSPYSSGLSVIDIRSPWMPIRIGFTSIGYDPGAIAIDSEYAYIGRSGCIWAVPECLPSFEIVDISNPLDPFGLGVLWYLGPRDPAVRDGIVLGWIGSTFGSIDCRDPWTPQILYLDNRGLRGRSGDSMALAGDLAFVTSGRIWPDHVSTMLNIYDIGDPTWPGRVDDIDIPGPGTGIAVSGDYAFVAGGDAGIFVYDVSACGLPTPRRSGGRAGP